MNFIIKNKYLVYKKVNLVLKLYFCVTLFKSFILIL